jgi:hypothetical protein
MSKPDTTNDRIIGPRKVFIPYIKGRIYDMWGAEPESLLIFGSREEAEKYNFTDVREVCLWEKP